MFKLDVSGKTEGGDVWTISLGMIGSPQGDTFCVGTVAYIGSDPLVATSWAWAMLPTDQELYDTVDAVVLCSDGKLIKATERLGAWARRTDASSAAVGYLCGLNGTETVPLTQVLDEMTTVASRHILTVPETLMAAEKVIAA